MISLQQLHRFFLTTGLAVLLATVITFGFGSADSWATTSLTQLISQPQAQIATMNQAKAVTKNIEGKAQEAIGKITGDPKDQAMGKAKQVEGQVRNAAEDIKDKMQLKGRAKAVTKNIEGKAQEAIGKITGDPKDQAMGKAKQVEGQVRNAAEDIKDKMQLKGRAKAVTKNIEGKAQEAIGKATGNRKDQVSGMSKQVESQARNAVEDVKETIQDILK